MTSLSAVERALYSRGLTAVAGVDEAGRGPLAGPVVAAAVIMPPRVRIAGVADSKVLRAGLRSELAQRIRAHAVAWAVGSASPLEIDELNILRASILAMHRAIAALSPPPDFLLVDGNRFSHDTLPYQTIVKGDATCFTIAAASILAKEHRDALMLALDEEYPLYGFARHKGYPTPMHIEALRRLGPTPVHRRSFTVRDTAFTPDLFDTHAHTHRHRPGGRKRSRRVS